MQRKRIIERRCRNVLCLISQFFKYSLSEIFLVYEGPGDFEISHFKIQKPRIRCHIFHSCSANLKNIFIARKSLFVFTILLLVMFQTINLHQSSHVTCDLIFSIELEIWNVNEVFAKY